MPRTTNHLSPYQRANALGLDVSLFRDDRPLLDALRSVGTLPRQNVAGQYDVGGGIGLRDVLGAMSSDPQITTGANLLAEVAPGSGNILAAQRIPTMYEAFKEAQNPIARTLRGAELGLEGIGAVADFVPAFAAGGAALVGLGGMMARNANEFTGLSKALRNQRGIIGGPNAKTADLDALEAAQRMKADGVDADNIHASTGWWLDHPDGRPRFEIDDAESFLEHPQNAPPEYLRIQHDAMQDAYPDFDKIQQALIKRPENYRGGGSYDPIHDTINAKGSTDPQIHSTALHELQHAIQSRENMARGGSPEMFPNVDNVFASLNQQSDLLDTRFANRLEAAQGDTASLVKLRRENPGEYARISELMGNYEVSNIEDLRAAIQKQWDIAERTITPSAQYRRLAGESEARLVQQRMNLTPAERAANPFYREFDVPIEDQIVRMEDGTMQAVDGVVVRPNGWDAQGDDFAAAFKPKQGKAYRGITQAEYDATIGSGSGVKSRGDYSFGSEGTVYSQDPRDAESYVNFGRDDPRKTGKPTYLVEVDDDGLKLDSDGYLKTGEAKKPTRIIKMEADNGQIVAHEIPQPLPTASQTWYRGGMVGKKKGVTFFVDNKETATNWAGRTGQVFESRINAQKTYDFDVDPLNLQDKYKMAGPGEAGWSMDGPLADLKSAGFDSYTWTEWAGDVPEKNIAVFNNADILPTDTASRMQQVEAHRKRIYDQMKANRQ